MKKKGTILSNPQIKFSAPRKTEGVKLWVFLSIFLQTHSENKFKVKKIDKYYVCTVFVTFSVIRL